MFATVADTAHLVSQSVCARLCHSAVLESRIYHRGCAACSGTDFVNTILSQLYKMIHLEVVINMKIKLKFERGCKSENSNVSHCKTVHQFMKTKVKQSESDLVGHVCLCCSALWVLNRWSSVYFSE